MKKSKNQARGLKNLRDFIKFKLKSKNMTYKDLSVKLSVSETTVKRWMSSRSFSIEELERIGQVLDFSQFETMQGHFSKLQNFKKFTLEQENHLVDHPFQQLMLIKIRDGLNLKTVCNELEITHSKAIKYLRSLEAAGFLELWPQDKVKIKLNGPFQLIKKGPLATKHFSLLRDYLFNHFRSNFAPLSEIESGNPLKTFRPFEFSLTPASNKAFVRELEELIGKYDQISTFECSRREAVEPVSAIIAVDRHDSWKNVLTKEHERLSSDGK